MKLSFPISRKKWDIRESISNARRKNEETNKEKDH